MRPSARRRRDFPRLAAARAVLLTTTGLLPSIALRVTAVNRVANLARKASESLRAETVGRQAEKLVEWATLHAIEHGSLAPVAGYGDAPAHRAELRRLQKASM